MEPVDVTQIKFEFESSKENLLETILKNKENPDTKMVAEAIKEFVQSHERYNIEKKRILEIISESKF